MYSSVLVFSACPFSSSFLVSKLIFCFLAPPTSRSLCNKVAFQAMQKEAGQFLSLQTSGGILLHFTHLQKGVLKVQRNSSKALQIASDCDPFHLIYFNLQGLYQSLFLQQSNGPSLRLSLLIFILLSLSMLFFISSKPFSVHFSNWTFILTRDKE